VMCTSGTPSDRRAITLAASSGTPRCLVSASRNRRASSRSAGGPASAASRMTSMSARAR
jgi:hypothetical protein